MKSTQLCIVLLGLFPRVATAQAVTETRNAPTTTSVYAQQRIELQPGFSTTTSGFEAVIKLPESTAGRWSRPLLWTDYERGGNGTGITGLVGIHTHVLPNGKVLSWEGHNADTYANPAFHTSHAYVWNSNPSVRSGGRVYPMVYEHYDDEDSNIFCSGHSFLSDGRLLVAGGHYSGGIVERGITLANPTPNPNLPVNNTNSLDYIPPTSLNPLIPNVNDYIGLRDVNIFNYRGQFNPAHALDGIWLTQQNSFLLAMQYRRWYPTNTTLADGRVLVTAGQRYGGPVGTKTTVQAEIPEVYTPGGYGSWRSVNNAARRLPLYPWMFQAPDGRVFNAGPNFRTGFLNLTTATINGTMPDTWTDGPLHQLRMAQNNGTTYEESNRGAGTAVMYAPGKVLILGGGAASGVTSTTELIDLNLASPQFVAGPSMAYARTHLDATLLPDGSVLVTGGTNSISTSDADAVLPAELWRPGNKLNPGGTWTTLNAMHVPRLYHSTAVLLPDATVLTTGGGQGGGYQTHPDYQLFTPPYLCKGYPRPQISSAPQAVAYGQSFTVKSPQAANISRATWVRLSSVTHSFDMNQRFMDLYPVPNQAGDLRITAPTNANVCPPGHYMLFLIDANGTPSHAAIMRITPTVCATSLSITQTPPLYGSSTECSRVTQFTASGGGAGAQYQWTINGQQLNATSATIDWTTSTDDPTAQVTVTLAGQTDCGASSTLISYFPGCGE